MKIISADYVYTDGIYQKDFAIVFDERIVSIGSFESMIRHYPDAEVEDRVPHSVLYPGFINTHVHLEFSANRTSLTYGDFIYWLDSVLEQRDRLLGECDDAMIEDAAAQMLRSGITSFGAISSFGTELEICKQIPQRVTFFNELIGSSAAAADMLYGDFLERVEKSLHTQKSDRITPAVAIHAPYSVHPLLLTKAIALAKEKELPLSTHFLESPHEREWLESHSGGFLGFFQKFFNTDRAVTSIDEFMSAFDNYPALFVHCTQATSRELDHLAAHGHSIAHCPRSNRLLNCGRLAIEEVCAPLSIATDGLSSNWSLNIWDELRAALMMHTDLELNRLSKELIDAVSNNAGTILKLNCGKIKEGYEADFAVVQLPEAPKQEEEIALWTILHTNEVAQLYIAGERYI